jgi:pimeloyl-ACP methyl ester carboxylesterase
MIVDLGGRSIFVEIFGPEDGDAAVLLHHGLGSTRAWKEQIPVFAGAGLRVIAYDRWGYGASDPRQGLGIPGFEQDVADLERLLDHLEIHQAHLVGHSDGGTIALYFAARYPKRVKKLVTIAAHVYVEEKMDPGIQAVAASYAHDKRLRRGLERVHGAKADQVFRNWYEGWRTEENRAWDMRSLLKTVQAQALVIQGSLDEHATPQHAADLAEALPQGDLWLVPGAGHMVPQENADVFNPRVLQFLTRHGEDYV